MANNKLSKFLILIKRDRKIILIIFIVASIFVGSSLGIYNYIDKAPLNEISFMKELADFLMTIGEAIIGIGLIGGVVNFVFEELRAEEKETQKLRKENLDKKEKRKRLRQHMQGKLQHAHDNVE